jgi:transcriptional regulator GlxA family with amidase domain
MHLYQEFSPHPALATHVACFWTSRALLARLHAHPDTAGSAAADRLARAAVRLVDDAGGAVRIDELARTLGVSRQHLGLHFRERVGLPPKTFAMVSRFRRAGAVLRRHTETQVDWPRLALDCGYYDQSHLIHAFRLFADETPDSFVRPRR